MPADPAIFTQIEARGPDAVSFLQAQLTQDLRAVTANRSPLAAWCDPQGRVRVVLRLLALDDGIGLVLPFGMAEEILTQLARYRLRARLELRRSPASWSAFAACGEHLENALDAAGLLPARQRDASSSSGGVTAVRLAGNAPTIEIYGDTAALEAAGLVPDLAMDAAQWARARIAAGIADVGAGHSGRFTPHMLNLDRLGAVNFDKGCYTGQEIIARTQHRGTAKRRLRYCRADYDVLAGDRLRAHGEEIGEVVAAAGHELLALLPVDAGGEPLAGRNGRVRVLTDRESA